MYYVIKKNPKNLNNKKPKTNQNLKKKPQKTASNCSINIQLMINVYKSPTWLHTYQNTRVTVERISTHTSRRTCPGGARDRRMNTPDTESDPTPNTNYMLSDTLRIKQT